MNIKIATSLNTNLLFPLRSFCRAGFWAIRYRRYSDRCTKERHFRGRTRSMRSRKLEHFRHHTGGKIAIQTLVSGYCMSGKASKKAKEFLYAIMVFQD